MLVNIIVASKLCALAQSVIIVMRSAAARTSMDRYLRSRKPAATSIVQYRRGALLYIIK